MAECYADSSFLVSLYRKDANQTAAAGFVEAHAPTVRFSPLNRIELRNAMRNLAARGEITDEDRRVALRQLADDLQSGILLHLPVSWTEAFRRADELSERHATNAGQRTIDLLHVAIALDSEIETFLSFDARQRKLAQAAGLKVKP